jgi:hypothetical protein
VAGSQPELRCPVCGELSSGLRVIGDRWLVKCSTHYCHVLIAEVREGQPGARIRISVYDIENWEG